MRCQVPYGKGRVDFETNFPCDVIRPNHVEAPPEQETIRAALDHPLGTEQFGVFSSRARRLVVLVNDHTRPTPTRAILEALEEPLAGHPDVRFIVATGTHRGPNEEELGFIFGRTLDRFRRRIQSHDARKDKEMAKVGTTSRGTEVSFSRAVTEADGLVVIGSVEPHYFAGYTGGRKSLLPGVASYKTIEQNHSHAVSEDADLLALEGNPVHEDMMEAVSLLKGPAIFSIQTVLTGDHRLYYASAGGLKESFDAAVAKAREVFCVDIKRKGNIVVTAAPYPMDVDLYQSQKALENGSHALEDGGTIILVSQCRMGVGDDTFLNLLASADSPGQVIGRVRADYKLGYHKAARIAQIAMRAKAYAVTDLPDDIIRKAKLAPRSSVQEAVDSAAELLLEDGIEPYGIVIPEGSLVVPVCGDPQRACK